MPEKIADKREAILEAALQLFSEKGFSETSTASISKAAKVATGTLFLYFESKEELINKLYLESKAALFDHIKDGLSEKKTFREQLKHIWDRNIEWALNNSLKCSFMTHFSSSPYITRMTREASLSNLSFLHELIQHAISNGEVAVTSPELLYNSIMGQLWGNSTALQQVADPAQRRQLLEEGFEILWRGIKK